MADPLYNEVMALFSEHYAYSMRLGYMQQKIEKLKRPAGERPRFWDLIILAEGPVLLLRLIRILKRHGIDLNQRNWRRENILHYMILNWAQETWTTSGIIAAMRLLVEAGNPHQNC